MDDDYDDPLDISLPRPRWGYGVAGGLGYGLGTFSLALFLVALAVTLGAFILGVLCALTWIFLFFTLILWYLGLWAVTLLNAAGVATGLVGSSAGHGEPRALGVALPGLLLNALAFAGELYLLLVVHHAIS